MCKVVYLTSRCFDWRSRQFKNLLADELRSRGIEVVTGTTCWLKCLFRKHRTYGIAIAIDFFRTGTDGCGLTLNKQCSYLSRDFAYALSNNLDLLTPRIRWREFKFVDSDDKDWYKFFNKVSSATKAIFYLCTSTNPIEYDVFSVAQLQIVKGFADEIVRCLRSNYDYLSYTRSLRISRKKYNIRNRKESLNNGVDE